MRARRPVTIDVREPGPAMAWNPLAGIGAALATGDEARAARLAPAIVQGAVPKAGPRGTDTACWTPCARALVAAGAPPKEADNP